jgi:hypothetical protein
MAGEKHSTEGSLDSSATAPHVLRRVAQQEVEGDGVPVAR